MKKVIASLAGAVALNILHQAVKQFESMGLTPPTGNALFVATLAGDILSNALYYSTGSAKTSICY